MGASKRYSSAASAAKGPPQQQLLQQQQTLGLFGLLPQIGALVSACLCVAAAAVSLQAAGLLQGAPAAGAIAAAALTGVGGPRWLLRGTYEVLPLQRSSSSIAANVSLLVSSLLALWGASWALVSAAAANGDTLLRCIAAAAAAVCSAAALRAARLPLPLHRSSRDGNSSSSSRDSSSTTRDSCSSRRDSSSSSSRCDPERCRAHLCVGDIACRILALHGCCCGLLLLLLQLLQRGHWALYDYRGPWEGPLGAPLLLLLGCGVTMQAYAAARCCCGVEAFSFSSSSSSSRPLCVAVTGAGGGICLLVCQLLLQRGFAVIACCKTEGDTARTAALLHDPSCPRSQKQQQQQQQQQQQGLECSRTGRETAEEGPPVGAPGRWWCRRCGFSAVCWDVCSSKETLGARNEIERFVKGALGAPRLFALVCGAGVWASFPIQVRRPRCCCCCCCRCCCCCCCRCCPCCCFCCCCCREGILAMVPAGQILQELASWLYTCFCCCCCCCCCRTSR